MSEGRPRLSRWVEAAARRPWLALALLVALVTGPSLFARDLWAADEVRHADALRGVLSGRHAVVLQMAGKPYGDKPPGWFWFVAAIERATRLPVPSAFFAASALGAIALAAATYALARAVGEPRVPALVAALVALSTPLVLGQSQTTRMDLAFSAAIAASLAAAVVGLRRPSPNRWVVLAGAASLVALGVKGPLGVVFPVVASVAWLAWTGRLRRLVALDVLAAVLGIAAGVGGYVLLAVRAEGWDFVERLVREQLWRRASSAGSHAGPFWFYVAIVPLAVAPWTAIAFGLPWRSARAAWRAALARRREAPSTDALGVAALSGLVVLSVVSAKNVVYAVPLVPPLSVLAVRALSRMGEAARARTFLAMGVVALALAAAVPFAERWLPEGFAVGGLAVLAAAFAVAGGATIALRRAPWEGATAVAALGVLLVAAVSMRFVAPTLDPVMSPRAQAEDLRDHVKAGYAPLIFRTYDGIYAWHADAAYPETGDPRVLERHVADHPRAVLSMPRHYFDKHGATLQGFRVEAERRIAEDVHVLLVRDGAKGGG